MGLIVVLAPTIGWTWPALGPIIAAVAAARGYKAMTDPKGPLRGKLTRKLEAWHRVSVPIDSLLTAVIAEELGNEERLNFEKDDMVLVFRKDARGKFFVEIGAPNTHSVAEMRAQGEELAIEIIRKFACHRLSEQLERANATIVEERIDAKGKITLKARRWR